MHRIVADPGAPTKLRIQALSKLDSPQHALLIRLMRNPNTPAKLRAWVNLRYAELMERKAKQKSAQEKKQEPLNTTNILGLKA